MNRANQSLPTEKSALSCSNSITRASFTLDGSPVIHIAICVIGMPMCVSTTLANLMMIISIWRTPSLHSPSNVLLVGLAFSDLGVGLLTLPTNIISQVAKIRQAASVFCKARTAEWIFGTCLCTVSLLTLSAISLDRYMAIHFHLRYREIVTVKRVIVALTFIWISGCVGSVFYGVQLRNVLTMLTSVILISSLAIIIFASWSIQRVVYCHQRQIASQMHVQMELHEEETSLNLPRFKKSFKGTQILCWILLLCYMPFATMTVITSATGSTPGKQSLLELSTLLLCSNSALNPILYCWRYQPIRIALLRMLRRIFSRHSVR